MEGNEFGTKVKVLGNGDARYLIYAPTVRPDDGDNWLLDLLLQGHEFKADRTSLAIQEMGLPYEFRSWVGMPQLHHNRFDWPEDPQGRQKLTAKELAFLLKKKADP